MTGREAGLGLGTVVSTGLAGVLFAALALSGPAPAPPTPAMATAGLSRFPALDSKQPIGAGLAIACRAYSNRPGFDVKAPVTPAAKGFRVVSDCRTVPA